ncbi:hypothetical protein XENORESO_016925, partial [Xenotaenia resolanae]
LPWSSGLNCIRMSTSPDLTFFPMLPTLTSSSPGVPAVEPNATSCQEWEQAHHMLFHLGNLSLLLGLAIPTTLGLHMIMLRLFLMTGQSPPTRRHFTDYNDALNT